LDLNPSGPKAPPLGFQDLTPKLRSWKQRQAI
jgi:hypothetical protein